MEHKDFKYCVVGNIVKERIDEDGSIKHGTIEFTGGTKVYLCGKYDDEDFDKIDVIGMSRLKTRGYRRYRVVHLPKKYIENVRPSIVFKKAILDIMNDWEFSDGWWHDSLENKKETEEYVKQWNNV